MLLYLLHIYQTLRIQLFSGNTAHNITMHGRYLIFQVTTTGGALRGALQIFLIKNFFRTTDVMQTYLGMKVAYLLNVSLGQLMPVLGYDRYNLRSCIKLLKN